MPYFEVVLEGRQGGNDMLNVFHYFVPVGQTPDWTAGADELRAHIANYLVPLCSTNVTWEGITVREDLPGEVGVFYPFTLGTLTGTSVEGDQLREASMLVRKRSLGGVRPVLGWFFQGGLTVHGTTGAGRWEATIVTDVQNFADDIRELGAVTTPATVMVIKARNPAAPNTQPYSVVDAVQAVNVPRTVRSRRESLGS